MTALAATAAALPGAALSQGGTTAPAAKDSTHAKVIYWPEVTALNDSGRVQDVAFSDPGLNIVNPGEMTWCADSLSRSLILVAAKPITGTAEAGEEIGRRGVGGIGDPAALHVCASGQFVLGRDTRLFVLRSGWTDTLDLAPVDGPARDVAVGAGGLVYVLVGKEVRIFVDPPRGAPLWKVPVPGKLGPAVAMTVSARGEVYLAGRDGVAVLDLDSAGVFRQVRARTASELGVRALGGVALTPALLVPLEKREGWVGQDRFLVLSDAGKPGIVALEASTLTPVGRIDLEAEAPGAVPGRLDVSNRAQIAFADPASGRALALPARLFAQLIGGAKIRWRNIEPDTTAAGSSGP